MDELKFRHETKHWITYSDYLAIRSRLKIIAKQDPHVLLDGRYRIRSIYFDNYNDKILREKTDSVNLREKFRIRYYNDDTSVINLEKKSKINGLSNKLSTRITKDQVFELLQGNNEILKDQNNALMEELYLKMHSQLLKPKVIVDYVREPYLYEPGNVRITFDMGIRSGIYSKAFFSQNIPLINTVDQGIMVMEVKYDEFLPEIIALLIQVNERKGTSVSKYELCRRIG